MAGKISVMFSRNKNAREWWSFEMTTIDSEEEGEAHLFACKCGGNATAVSCGARAAPIDSKVVKIKLSKKEKKT